MRICFKMDPTTVDPRKNADMCTSCIQFLIYEGLTQMGPGGAVEMALAQSVDTSEDGCMYTFHLRDAVWSDGTPITAYDFEHSWKTTLTPQFAASCPNLFYSIKNAEKALHGTVSPSQVGVQALDEKTLRVKLENPTPYFLSLITFCNFYPIPLHVEKKNPSWEYGPTQALVQSGPFKMVKWERNQEIVLEKNSNYWNAKKIHLDGIHISIIPDERTPLQMFFRGELDYLTTATSSIPLDDLAECKKQGLLRTVPVGGLVFCAFNTERFPFDNVNLRKALALAIDRKAITDHITQMDETPALQLIPPVMLQGVNRPIFPSYNPTLAQEYLQRALNELGVTKQEISDALVLSFEGKDLYKKIALTIQYQWKKILNLDTRFMEGDKKVTAQQHMSRDYQVALEFCVAQYNDPSNILDRFKYKVTKKNFPGFENADYIRFLNEASMINDPGKRFTLLQRAEDVLAKEMPLAPLFYYQQGDLINPAFTNVEVSPIGNLLFKNIAMRD